MPHVKMASRRRARKPGDGASAKEATPARGLPHAGEQKRADRTSRSSRTDWQTVREAALALPGAEESTSYGTPAFKVRGKLFVRFHQSGESIVINIAPEEREALMGLKPECFYITDHYRCWPYMLVRLAAINRRDLTDLIEESWRRAAPRHIVADYDAQANSRQVR